MIDGGRFKKWRFGRLKAHPKGVGKKSQMDKLKMKSVGRPNHPFPHVHPESADPGPTTADLRWRVRIPKVRRIDCKGLHPPPSCCAFYYLQKHRDAPLCTGKKCVRDRLVAVIPLVRPSSRTSVGRPLVRETPPSQPRVIVLTRVSAPDLSVETDTDTVPYPNLQEWPTTQLLFVARMRPRTFALCGCSGIDAANR